MKRTLCASSLLILLSLSGFAQGHPEMAKLGWISGCWKSEGNVQTEEHWTKLEGQSMLGIGRTIALKLARQGADLIVHGHTRREAAEQLARDINRLGRRAKAVLADLAERPEREHLVNEAWNWTGKVDIWINNAGADVLTGEAASWPFGRKLERLWQVDVRATIGLSRSAGRRLKAARQHVPGQGAK